MIALLSYPAAYLAGYRVVLYIAIAAAILAFLYMLWSTGGPS